jgi:ubiquinone/menaquinone biosynthesis C-methylase UbiE
MREGNPKNEASETNGWSDGAHAARYDVEVNRAFYRATLARLLEGAPTLAGRGLDLGCGTGFSTEGLLEMAPDVTWHGADCSREMVELARRKPGLRKVDLFDARAEALPFPDASFDVVVANFSWHWFGEAAGQEVRRVLRPGGWLLATLPLRRFSSASGNRALAHALLAGRSHYARRASQGFRFEEVPNLLPGRVARHEPVVVSERFADSGVLREVLESRGALAAIFGDQPPIKIEAPSPVDFEWPFAVLHMRV